MKKLLLIWSIVLMAVLSVAACETQEEQAPPATSEPTENPAPPQGTDEQQPAETIPSDQGGTR